MGEHVTILFGLTGGLALFLYGMNSMSDALQKAAGEGMKKILSFLTKNAVMGALAGMAGNRSASEQFRYHCYGDRICQRRFNVPATGNFCYFWCQYRYHHDSPVDGI